MTDLKDFANLIASILIAGGYGAKVWAKGAERIYVSRKLSKGTQDMGYVEIVIATGERNYNPIERATKTIRDMIESDPRVAEFVAADMARGEFLAGR